MVEAGAVINVLLIADGATVHVDIVIQITAITATDNKGGIRPGPPSTCQPNGLWVWVSVKPSLKTTDWVPPRNCLTASMVVSCSKLMIVFILRS